MGCGAGTQAPVLCMVMLEVAVVCPEHFQLAPAHGLCRAPLTCPIQVFQITQGEISRSPLKPI